MTGVAVQSMAVLPITLVPVAAAGTVRGESQGIGPRGEYSGT